MPRSAVLLGAIGVLVSAVLLSMASGRLVHALYMHGPRTAGRVSPPLLVWLAAGRTMIHVGMLQQCRVLGLGVKEISIAAGTGADVMAGGSGAAEPA